MLVAHKIRLMPNNKQITYFKKACGVARFAYNWALQYWREWYAQYQLFPCVMRPPNEGAIRAELNRIKREAFPWMLEVSKCVPQLAIRNGLRHSFVAWWSGKAKYPQYRKKHDGDRFELSNDTFKLDGKRVYIPKLGWVRMRQRLRFNGEVRCCVISRQFEHWYAAITVKIDDTKAAEGTATNNTLGNKLGDKLGDNLDDRLSFVQLIDGCLDGSRQGIAQSDAGRLDVCHSDVECQDVAHMDSSRLGMTRSGAAQPGIARSGAAQSGIAQSGAGSCIGGTNAERASSACRISNLNGDTKIGRSVIGVDVGLTTLATLSTGEKIQSRAHAIRYMRRLKMMRKALKRKQGGRRFERKSRNYRKMERKIRRLEWRMRHMHRNDVHHLTRYLATTPAVVGIEQLRVRDMMTNSHVAQMIRITGVYEFRRQMMYKKQQNLVCADQWFPSSQRCSQCHTLYSADTQGTPWNLNIRRWQCMQCGADHDRDINAAENLRQYALKIHEH